MISSAQLILACDIYWQIESPKIPFSDWEHASPAARNLEPRRRLFLARTSMPLIALFTLRWQTPVCGGASPILGRGAHGDSAGSTAANFFSYETYGLGLQKKSRK
jgi:hypothetical protein